MLDNEKPVEFKIGDRIGINPELLSTFYIKTIRTKLPDLRGFIIKINHDNSTAYITKNNEIIQEQTINNDGWWIGFKYIEIISFKPTPEPQKEPVFIPSCSDCKSKHYSAMDESKPCYECYGGENSNFVFMG